MNSSLQNKSFGLLYQTSLNLVLLLFTFHVSSAELVVLTASEGFHSIGYTNVSPESPNAKRIAYSRALKGKTAVIVSNIDGTNKSIIDEFDTFTLHNGARIIWLTNNILAYMPSFRSLKVVDIRSNEVIYSKLDYILSANSSLGRVLILPTKFEDTNPIYLFDAEAQEDIELISVQVLRDYL